MRTNSHSRMPSGGKRPGAGRPRIEKDGIRKTVSFRVSPETAARLAELRRRGYQVGRLFDDFIALYFKSEIK